MGESEEIELTDKTCCICLLDRDEKGFITSIECESVNCKQNFHATCLFQVCTTIFKFVKYFLILVF